jgi:hypothetical protein
MCVIGVFLLFYRYSNWPISGRFHCFARQIKVGRELLPRLAGGAALGVAFFHTAPAHDATLAQEQLMKIHLGCAITLFALLGTISFFYFPEGRSQDQRDKAYRFVYRVLGLIMWLSLVAALALDKIFHSFYNRVYGLFWLETVMVIAFSLSWIIKGQFVRGLARFTVKRTRQEGLRRVLTNLDRGHR